MSSRRLFVVLTTLIWSKMTSNAAVTDLKNFEFMASNSATLQDEDNAYSDWIEIHNTGNRNHGRRHARTSINRWWCKYGEMGLSIFGTWSRAVFGRIRIEQEPKRPNETVAQAVNILGLYDRRYCPVWIQSTISFSNTKRVIWYKLWRVTALLLNSNAGFCQWSRGQ